MIVEYTYEGDFPLFEIRYQKYKLSGIDNNLLAQEVLAKQVRKSTDATTPLYEDTLFQPGQGSQGHALLDAVEDIANKNGLHIEDWWSQIHHPLESTNTHHHGKYIGAFVYYVKVPEGAGDIVFDLEDVLVHNIKPVEGTLLLFPAWCKHRVTKNLSKEIRISIAGNLGHIAKD